MSTERVVRVPREIGQNGQVHVVTPGEAETNRRLVVLQAELAEHGRKLGQLETEAAALREADRKNSERIARLEALLTSTRRGEP